MKHLHKGDDAPEFSADSSAGPQTLNDYRDDWLVLYFYPKDATPGCTKEACDFRDRAPDMNAKILGVSPDPLASHADFAKQHSLPFPLISDPDHNLAKKYGAWGEKKNYGKTYVGLIRSTFIISPEG